MSWIFGILMIVIFKYSNIVYLNLVSSQQFHRKIFDWTLDKSVYILRLGDNERGIMGKILKDMSGESANICQFYKKEEDAFFKNGEFCMKKKSSFQRLFSDARLKFYIRIDMHMQNGILSLIFQVHEWISLKNYSALPEID